MKTEKKVTEIVNELLTNNPGIISINKDLDFDTQKFFELIEAEKTPLESFLYDDLYFKVLIGGETEYIGYIMVDSSQNGLYYREIIKPMGVYPPTYLGFLNLKDEENITLFKENEITTNYDEAKLTMYKYLNNEV